MISSVQNTFGAMVKREINIANERRHRAKKSDVEATFHRVNSSRSAPSWTTIPSTSESDFVSIFFKFYSFKYSKYLSFIHVFS